MGNSAVIYGRIPVSPGLLQLSIEKVPHLPAGPLYQIIHMCMEKSPRPQPTTLESVPQTLFKQPVTTLVSDSLHV